MSASNKRIVIYLVLFTVITGGYKYYTWWTPADIYETDYFSVATTGTTEQVQSSIDILDALYEQYIRLHQSQMIEADYLLSVRLYVTREEMHEFNPLVPNWAEGFYDGETSHQYLQPYRLNPHDSLIHETVHQINKQILDLDLPQWAEEGLACFFANCAFENGVFNIELRGQPSYPSWHVSALKLSGDLQQDIADKKLLSLRDIISDHKPHPINTFFNMYYVQWYTLVDYFMLGDGGRHREVFLAFIKNNAPLDDFEKTFGALEQIEQAWYAHVQQLAQLDR